MPQVTAINVAEEAIGVTLPSTTVKMLLVQPYLELQRPFHEPFKLRDDCKTRMMAGIEHVFAVAATFHPHVILFPEFSLPGIEAVEDIKSRMRSEHSPSILIGGLHGLTRDEYAALCNLADVTVHVDPLNDPARVGAEQWVNTSVTFLKDDQGALSLWLQPKVSPSWPETNTVHQSMFQGGTIHVFRAKYDNEVPCRFFSLICFDWIGQEHGATVPELLLTSFNESCRTGGSPQSVHFAFILQYNKAPNDHTFLNATSHFLTHASDHPFVQRENAAIVMACTAGRKDPGRVTSYGFTSLVFGPRAPFETRVCRPTFSTTLRSKVSDILDRCKDVVFREMGECIHGVSMRVPAYVVPDSTDRTAPLDLAEVFSFSSPVQDPRVPDAPVSPVTKWVNDELDTVPDLADAYFQGHQLHAAVKTAHENVVAQYRRLPSQDLGLKLHSATAGRLVDTNRNNNPTADVDDWSTHESAGLGHVMHSLGLLASVSPIDANSSALHARHRNGVEIAAIRGSTHDICRKALTAVVDRTHSPILFVSRDDNNVGLLPVEVNSFVDPRQGAGLRVTDSHELLTHARTSTPEEYEQFVSELCNVSERRFI